MIPPQLISLDFDGTLYLEDGDPPVHSDIHDALIDWKKRGAMWLVNTGRTLPHTLEGVVQAEFPDKPDFLITRERDIFTRNAVGRWVALGTWNARCDEEHHQLFKRSKSVFKEIQRYVEAETSAMFYSQEEEPAGIIATSVSELEDICIFIDPMLTQVPMLRYERNSVYLRFSHAGFTKGSALAHLSAHLGLSAAQVFAAGDNHNDMSMMDVNIAAHLACPSNAIPEVRLHVNTLGGHVSELPGAEGTAEALMRLSQFFPFAG